MCVLLLAPACRYVKFRTSHGRSGNMVWTRMTRTLLPARPEQCQNRLKALRKTFSETVDLFTRITRLGEAVFNRTVALSKGTTQLVDSLDDDATNDNTAEGPGTSESAGPGASDAAPAEQQAHNGAAASAAALRRGTVPAAPVQRLEYQTEPTAVLLSLAREVQQQSW